MDSVKTTSPTVGTHAGRPDGKGKTVMRGTADRLRHQNNSSYAEGPGECLAVALAPKSMTMSAMIMFMIVVITSTHFYLPLKTKIRRTSPIYKKL